MDSETAREPANSVRGAGQTIVALGDSITFGWGLPAGQSYPALLHRRLDQGTRGSKRWRVINAGVPGDTVLCAERRYARDVAPWQAEALIVSLGLNDAALRRTRIDEQRERLWLAYRDPWVRWRLRLGRVWTWTRGGMGSKPRAIAKDDSPVEKHRSEPRVRPDLYVRVLEDMITRAQAQGLVVYLLSLPPLAWERLAVDQAASYRHYDSLIRQVARISGATLIDVAGAPPVRHGTCYWQEDGIHLAADGQAWLAQCIGDTLERDGRDP